MFQIFFVVVGLVTVYYEFIPNWGVAREFLPSLGQENQLTPERRLVLRDSILQSYAEMLVIVTSIQRDMIAPISVVYAAVLFGTFYEFPLSWEAFAFLIPTLGHLFLVWIAGNHRKKVERYIRTMPSEDQSEVFRLAKLFQARLIDQ